MWFRGVPFCFWLCILSYYEALREQCICRHGCCCHCYLLFLRAPAFDTGGETKCHKSVGTKSTSWICQSAHAGDVCAFASGAAERMGFRSNREWDFAVIENLQHADFFADECVPDDGRCPSSVCVCALIAVHVFDTGLAVRRTCSKDSISGRRTLNSWTL